MALGIPGGSVFTEPAKYPGFIIDVGSTLGLGRSGRVTGSMISCLEKSHGPEAWGTGHIGVAKLDVTEATWHTQVS